ncbi:MAG: lamin tail domain-containing protein [Patescibacteria group bacterium]|nr:lamin tail domain-containing protein [Patescibacteria group bacterium]
MLKRFWKSRINKRLVKSAGKLAVFAFLLLFISNLGKIQGTNSFFMDTATVAGNEMTAGYWIPELTMDYSPSSPDGDNGFFKTAPCVTLEAKLGGSVASLSEVDIFYEFSNDGNPVAGGTKYDGTCVEIPDGNSIHFQAQAVNKDNPDWKSNVEGGQFKVDTICPVVKITNPDSGDTLSGSVEIRGTVTDANPHHYWLVVENSSGAKVAGPGTVNDSISFTNKKFFDWDTTAVPDGDYKIKLEARDAAGNKCPNLAPVPADPNDPNDSVDWIDVKVQNTPVVHAGDVMINEVMWMGSKDKPNDQWIELKNVSGKDMHIKDWYLTYKSDAGNENELFEIKDNRIIKSGEYLLISYYTKNNSAINVNPDYDVDKIFGYSKFQIKLYTDKTKTNLIDTAGSGDKEPTKGDKTNFFSMERSSTPGTGSDYANWYTCLDAASTTSYWDSGRTERGTPGAANMSDNDPILEKDELIEVSPLAKKLKAGEKTESENISQNIPIKIIGVLDVAEELKYKIKQKIKKVDIQGDFPDKEINIDLGKLGLVEKTGEIKIRISDLDLPEGAKVVSPKKNELVLLVTVKNKNSKNQKQSKKKKRDGITAVDQAVALKTDNLDKAPGENNDGKDKKNGDGEDGGDKENNNKANPKNVF